MRKVGKVSTPRPSIVDVTAVSDAGFAAVAADCSREAAAIPSNVTVARYVRLLFIWDSPFVYRNFEAAIPGRSVGMTASECFGQPAKLPKKSLEHKLDIRAR